MPLTKSDKRILSAVTRTNWPQNSLVILLVIITGGLLSLGLAVVDIVRIDGIGRYAGDHRTLADVHSLHVEGLIYILIASTALMSAIFFWIVRRFGLLLRKLGDKHDT